MSECAGFATTLDGRTRLHWETAGRGDPVLLIMGLGLGGGAWWRTVPVLARRLQVITYDNRGVGLSRAFSHAYTTEALAADALTVLDAVGVERAHVYGISLGGMVAQVLAVRHPERVRSLVLGATSPGGPRAVRPAADVATFFRRRARMDGEEAARESVAYSYGERCRAEQPERIEEDLALRLAQPFSERAYRAQLFAAAWHNCLGALGRIAAPTLIVHGAVDRMIPVGNAELMAERIPGARLRVLEDAGHMYPTEEPKADQAIARFLAESRREAA
jgi:pimeloyl-ACP methyl ester carboxylesterase